jgi:chemotaxis protein methyltransferase CheR
MICVIDPSPTAGTGRHEASAPMETPSNMEIDDATLCLIRELVHEKLGIFISPEKDYLVRHKIGRLLSRGDYKDARAFYERIKADDMEGVENLIRYVTTTHTFFFRERKHLTVLKDDVIRRGIQRPCIWVAACSTGEEVYSIIIELLEHGISDFFIVATDLNREVMLHLKKGIYSAERMKELSGELVRKYFKPYSERSPYSEKDRLYKVKDYLKRFFIVKKVNLIDNFIFERRFDYIFCRNVLIYFDEATRKKVIATLLRNLDDRGCLFVGHAESLFNVTDRVESVFPYV